jgi:hypothetical protein
MCQDLWIDSDDASEASKGFGPDRNDGIAHGLYQSHQNGLKGSLQRSASCNRNIGLCCESRLIRIPDRRSACMP